MAIIYGYRREAPVDIGPVLPQSCRCGALDFWRLAHATTWFTLFWIKIFPYNEQDFLVCPKCQRGVELRSRGAAAARALIPTAEEFIAGTIDVNAFRRAVGESGLTRTSGSLNWDLVRVAGVSRTFRVLVAIVPAVIGFSLGGPVLQRLPPSWPAPVYWVGYGVMFLAAVAVGWLTFRLVGLVEQRRRSRLNASN